MRKFLALIMGTALASGMAVAQQEQDPTQDPMDETQDQVQEQTSEYGEEVGEWDQRDSMSQAEEPTQTEDSTMGETETQESTTYGQESTTEESTTYSQEMEMEHGLSDMTVEELQGTTVVTATGEEIGEIDSIGQSEEHQERIATVDVGGFLGVAEKTIAIPLSELEMSSDGNVQTTLTKETIESQEEFDEQGFTPETGTEEDTGY